MGPFNWLGERIQQGSVVLHSTHLPTKANSNKEQELYSKTAEQVIVPVVVVGELQVHENDERT